MMQYITDYFSSILKKYKPKNKSTKKPKTITTEPETASLVSSVKKKIVNESKRSATVMCSKKPISKNTLLVTESAYKKNVTNSKPISNKQTSPTLSAFSKSEKLLNQYNIPNKYNQKVNDVFNENTIIIDDTKYEVLNEKSATLMNCINDSINFSNSITLIKEPAEPLVDNKKYITSDQKVKTVIKKSDNIQYKDNLNKGTKNIKRASLTLDANLTDINNVKTIIKKADNIQYKDNLNKGTKNIKRASLTLDANLTDINNVKTIIKSNRSVSTKSSKSYKAINVNSLSKPNTLIAKNLKNSKLKPMSKKNVVKIKKPLMCSKTTSTNSTVVASKNPKTIGSFRTKYSMRKRSSFKARRQVSLTKESSSEDDSNYENNSFNNMYSLSLFEVVIDNMSSDNNIPIYKESQSSDDHNESSGYIQKRPRIHLGAKVKKKKLNIKTNKRSKKNLSSMKKPDKFANKNQLSEENHSDKIFSEEIKNAPCDNASFIKQENITDSEKIETHENNSFSKNEHSSIFRSKYYDDIDYRRRQMLRRISFCSESNSNDKISKTYTNTICFKDEKSLKYFELNKGLTDHKNTNTQELLTDDKKSHLYKFQQHVEKTNVHKYISAPEKIPACNISPYIASIQKKIEQQESVLCNLMYVDVMPNGSCIRLDIEEIIAYKLEMLAYKSQAVDDDTSYNKNSRVVNS